MNTKKLEEKQVIEAILIIGIVIIGSYFIISRENNHNENIITENAVNLALSEEDVSEYIENIQENESSYGVEESKSGVSLYFAGASPEYNYEIVNWLDRHSSISGAQDSFNSAMENKGNEEKEEAALNNYASFLPENKASELLEKGEFEIGEESFARYYENKHNLPVFAIDFVKKNIHTRIVVLSKDPEIVFIGIKLAETIENHLK